MEAFKQIIVEYLPTILATIMSAIVALIGKRLSANGNSLESSVKRTVSLLETKNNERIELMEQTIAAEKLENAELKRKLNKVIEELSKVEVQDDQHEN